MPSLSLQFFALKVQVSQMMSVVLQAWTKLPLHGAFVSVHPRVGPISGEGGLQNEPRAATPCARAPPTVPSTPARRPRYIDIGYVEYYDEGGSPSYPIFWTMLAALIVNAIYPMVLLVQRDAFWNRRAVAAVDAMLDLVFGQVFFFTMLLNGMFRSAKKQVIVAPAH